MYTYMLEQSVVVFEVACSSCATSVASARTGLYVHDHLSIVPRISAFVRITACAAAQCLRGHTLSL